MTEQRTPPWPHRHAQGGQPHQHAAQGEHHHDHQARAVGYQHAHAAKYQHAHGPGCWGRVRHRAAHLIVPHGHEAADKVDRAMEASAEGMRTLRISLVVLGLTTLLQALVVSLSGSVALLG